MESSSLNIRHEAGVSYITFPSFEKTGLVRHLFSTRQGGVSQGVWASMNLGLSRGDNPVHVLENYRRICFVAGTYPGDTVFSQQVHGSRILYVDQQDRGKGLIQPVEMEAVDGLITDRPQVALVTFHADCVPVFFLDPVRRVIGLAHAGWRGTVAQISAKMIDTMVREHHSRPEDILVGIGPSIGPCCFEVGPEVEAEFERAYPEDTALVVRPAEKPDKRMVDLWEANRLSLQKSGVPRDNITMPDLCTACHPDYFYSHRKMGNQRGSQIALLELR